MEILARVLLVLVAVNNFIPVYGVLGGEALRSLYDVPTDNHNVLLLLRHRAVFFGLLGAFLFAAAIRKALLPYAATAGFVSMLSFVVLAATQCCTTDKMTVIAMFDIAAPFLLLLSLALSSYAGQRAH